jgi:hypothetical protein
MKFAAIALFAGAAAAVETITISHFVYVAVNGYPQLSFQLSAGNTACAADHYVVEGTYSCEDPAYTFQILEEQGHKIRLSHTVDG